MARFTVPELHAAVADQLAEEYAEGFRGPTTADVIKMAVDVGLTTISQNRQVYHRAVEAVTTIHENLMALDRRWALSVSEADSLVDLIWRNNLIVSRSSSDNYKSLLAAVQAIRPAVDIEQLRPVVVAALAEMIDEEED